MNSQLETAYRYVESRLRKRNIVMLEQDAEARQRVLNELEKCFHVLQIHVMWSFYRWIL